MQRAPDERVTRSLAREIARREQLKALVAGSIGSLGSHYVLALEAINAETGDVMAREQVEAASKEQVLTSLGAATSRLREKLGESLASIQKFDVPLPRATTPVARGAACVLARARPGPDGSRRRGDSAPEAGDRARSGLRDGAGAVCRRVYANADRTAEAPAFSRRAFELRERVSERERFFLSWRYYIDAAQAWDKALDLARSWTATYPREAFAFNSLGLASSAFGQHDQAVRAFREAIRIDPKFVPPHRNLTGSLIALNRFEEARSVLRKATADGIDSLGLRQMGYLLAFLGQRFGGRHAGAGASARSAGGDVVDQFGRADVEIFRTDSAPRTSCFSAACEAALRDNFQELGARWMVEDAETHAIVGQCGEARRETSAALDLGRDNFTLERASRALALCDAAGEASSLSVELANRFPDATLTTRVQLPVTAAALAIRRGEPGARPCAAGSGQAVRSRPGGRVLAGLPSRSGVSRTERRTIGRGPVPKHPRPSRRVHDLAALPAGASRRRPCRRPGRRRRAGPQGLRRISCALAGRRFGSAAARASPRRSTPGSSSTLHQSLACM